MVEVPEDMQNIALFTNNLQSMSTDQNTIDEIIRCMMVKQKIDAHLFSACPLLESQPIISHSVPLSDILY